MRDIILTVIGLLGIAGSFALFPWALNRYLDRKARKRH